MAMRVFLGFFGLLSVVYGLYCFLRPDFLAGFAGVAASSTTGTVELRAMYGGLQSAIGALSLAATVRHHLERPALIMLASLLPGLAAARLLGLVLDGSWSSYTAMGLAFEISGSLVAIALLRSR